MKTYIFLFLLLIVSSCSAAQVEGEGSEIVRLTVIDSGSYSTTKEKEISFYQIGNKDEFESIFRKIHSAQIPPPSIPEIDFNSKIAIVIVLGQKPTGGYSINIENDAKLEDGILSVKVNIVKPQPGSMLTQAFTNPYIVAEVNKNGIKTINFLDSSDILLKKIDLMQSSQIEGGK